jgi:hypothetical protein
MKITPTQIIIWSRFPPARKNPIKNAKNQKAGKIVIGILPGILIIQTMPLALSSLKERD